MGKRRSNSLGELKKGDRAGGAGCSTWFVVACGVGILTLPVGLKIGCLLLAAGSLYFGRELKSYRTRLFRDAVTPHLPALGRQKTRLTNLGPYGELDDRKWSAEKVRFINSVLVVPFSRHALMEYGTHWQSILEQEVGDYLDANPAILDAEAELRECLDGEHFEILCACILRDAGWSTSLTPASGDQGADILATRDSHRLAVQCKFYTGSVGNGAVQEVIAARLYYDCNAAAVVTNATFTKSAIALARSSSTTLVHFSELGSFAKSRK